MNETINERIEPKQIQDIEPLRDLLLLARRMRQSCEPLEKISSVTGLSREILKRNGVI
jgi:hypothetical protein